MNFSIFKFPAIIVPSYFLLLFAVGCSSTPDVEIPEEIASLENLAVIEPDAEPQNSFEFKPVARFGDNDEVLVGRFGGSAVDNRGRVFIADSDQNVIHAFDSYGSYITQVGREGQGPGEFGNISTPRVDDNFLYAYDWSQRQINAFDLESLQFSHVVRLMREDWNIEELEGLYPNGYYIRSDGSFLVNYSGFFTRGQDDNEERFHPIFRISGEEEIDPEPVFRQRAPQTLTDQSGDSFAVMYSPFLRMPLLDVAGDDRILSAWSEEFLIKFFSPDGDYEKAIYSPYQRSQLDRGEMIDRYEDDPWRRIIRNADMPEVWPALRHLNIDDENRIWVSTIIDDQELYQWWVINPDGELQTRFEWPRNRNIQSIRNGHLYVQETDPETDLQQIVKYRIEETGH